MQNHSLSHKRIERYLKYSVNALGIDDLGAVCILGCAIFLSLIYYRYIICEGSFDDVIALQKSNIKLQKPPISKKCPAVGNIILLSEKQCAHLKNLICKFHREV